MYCLKVSLRCIHWSSLYSFNFHFNEYNVNGNEEQIGPTHRDKGRECNIDRPFCYINNNQILAPFRVSRGSRTFWRLQNISGPAYSRNTKNDRVSRS